MLEALIITLREGVEAGLVVGIIVAFLRREEMEHLMAAVWAGVGAAVLASFAGAWVLYRLAINEEAFEGLLYLASALIVSTLLIWMWRHAHAMGEQMRGTLARITSRGGTSGMLTGLFLFTFFMIFREGVETVLFLSAVSLSTSGLGAFFGAALGLAAAVVFTVLFVRGSLRIALGRFFAVTGVALLIFVLQLLLNAYHELSEAGWLPANPTTMAVVGPLVQRDVFFLAAVLLLPVLMLLVPGAVPTLAREETNPAEERLARARLRGQRRARLAAGALGVLILAAIGLHTVYAQRPMERSPAVEVEAGTDGAIRIPLARVDDGDLHRFAARVDGVRVRFIAISSGDERRVATAFDACLICGDQGYQRQGSEIFCLHCASVIYPPSIGQSGGCNPIPLASTVEGGELVVRLADLAAGAGAFR